MTVPEHLKPAVARLLRGAARHLRGRGLAQNVYFQDGDGAHFSVRVAHADSGTRCCVLGGIALSLFDGSRDAFPSGILPDCQRFHEFPALLQHAVSAIAFLGLQAEASEEGAHFGLVVGWSDQDGRSAGEAADLLERTAALLVA